MKFISLKPNSDEWLHFRKNKIGASDCSAIMGDNPFQSPQMLWEEKISEPTQISNPHIERGKRLEPIALKEYNEKTSSNFIPKVAISSDREWQMASFDGIDEEKKQVLEIKSPSEFKFQAIKREGKPPKPHLWQVQHQLCVSGYEEGILFIYTEKESLIFPIQRDEYMIFDLLEKESKFYFTNMMQWVGPNINYETKHPQ